MSKQGNFLSPAKLNLFLKVLGKRDDGYHDLISLVVPITIYDELFVEVVDFGRRQIDLWVEGDKTVPADETNLVYKATMSFLRATGCNFKVSIGLKKRIPTAAGLGGGSSDAATALLALNKILGFPLIWKELYPLARGLGADVPTFLLRRPCLITGIGDIITTVEDMPSMWFLVVVPDVQVSTRWAYAHLKLGLTTPCIPYINKQVWTELEGICGCLMNDLEEVTLNAHPQVKAVKEMLKETGAKGVLMSGSGPSVFGIFEEEPEDTIVEDIKAKGWAKIFKAKIFHETDWGVVKR